MKALDAYPELRRAGQPVITTQDAAARLRTSVSNASHALRSMEDAGLVRRIRRGLWALDPELDPLVLAPFLTSPFPAYVSLWTALAKHGMIEQIPKRVSVASLDRSKEISTSLGVYSIHHLEPEVFGGFVGTESDGYIAEPEKALFDMVYVRVAHRARSRVYLPELSLPRGFRDLKLERWLKRVQSARLRTLVASGIEDALRQASPEPAD